MTIYSPSLDIRTDRDFQNPMKFLYLMMEAAYIHEVLPVWK